MTKYLITFMLCLCLCGCGKTMEDSMMELEANGYMFSGMQMSSPLDRLLAIDREKRYFLICRISKKDMEEIEKYKKWVMVPKDNWKAVVKQVEDLDAAIK